MYRAGKLFMAHGRAILSQVALVYHQHLRNIALQGSQSWDLVEPSCRRHTTFSTQPMGRAAQGGGLKFAEERRNLHQGSVGGQVIPQLGFVFAARCCGGGLYIKRLPENKFYLQEPKTVE